MRSEVKHLDVPTQQVKLGRSKSLNTPRSSSYNAMRSKRTHSLPNREKLTLPVVQIIQETDNERIELENNFSDRESERYCWTGNECQIENDDCEPLVGLLLSVAFLIWSRILDLLQ